MAEKVLNLIPGDLDRPIRHIKPNIDCPDLEQLILESMNSVAPVEREVRDHTGHWYSLRVRPYKNVENKIDGAVLTLFDVDAPKRSEQRVRMARDYGDAIMAIADQPIAVLDSGLRVQAANAQFVRILGKPVNAVVGQHLFELDGSWKLDILEDRIRASFGAMSGFERTPVEVDGDGASRRTMWLTGRWLPWHESPDTQVLLLALSTQETSDVRSEV
jgi:two-component system, chemotaxis family, CheB/CheR fusion protein